MSDEKPRDAQADANAKVKAQNGGERDTNGNRMKALAGAVAAVAVLAGGYFVLKNMPTPGQPHAEVASTDAGYDATSSAQPLPGAGDPAKTADIATTASTSTTETRTTAATRPRRHVTAAADNVPETVIGITPVSATQDDNEVVVTGQRRPVWSRTPNARRLSALYPEGALERGREGEASVHCTVQDGGSLNCVRTSEMPANSGFGTAALSVARAFRHAPQRADGSSAVGTPVNLRVVFRISDKDHHMPPHT